jgi:hypothetical protein
VELSDALFVDSDKCITHKIASRLCCQENSLYLPMRLTNTLTLWGKKGFLNETKDQKREFMCQQIISNKLQIMLNKFGEYVLAFGKGTEPF